MPTVLRIGPYRFFFYSNEGSEPPHVHVERDAAIAKFWLDPARLERSGGFKRSDLSVIQRLVEEHSPTLLAQWHEYFGS